MFGLFGTIAKLINDQIAEYATTQAEVASRAIAGWQPVPIETTAARERRLRRLAMQNAASRH